MRICYVCGEYPPASHGGIGSVTQVLGRALAASGHEVRVAGLYSSLDGLAETDCDQGVDVWRLPMPGGKFGWTKGRRRLFQMLSRWADRDEIDVIEVPDWEGYAAGWPALRVPVVTRLHGSITYFAREMNARLHWPAYCLEALSFHRADACCSTSAYTATKTQKLFGSRPKPVPVLFNPVEVSDSDIATERDPNRVVFAGTLTAKKGVVSLTRAWPHVARKHSGAELHLFGKDAGAGDGRPMRELLSALLSAEISETVHFHGHVDRERLKREFQNCRLAVFPSYAEAFGMVVLEAMAQGCPVVYSERCSGPELIEPGRNGLLVNPDSPEQIAEAILALMADDVFCGRVAAEGRRTVRENYSCEVLLRRNEQFYYDCIRRQ